MLYSSLKYRFMSKGNNSNNNIFTNKIYVHISYYILRAFLQVITVTNKCAKQTKNYTSHILCLHISATERSLLGIESAKICNYQNKNIGITSVTCETARNKIMRLLSSELT
jgi:hypothetical protein